MYQELGNEVVLRKIYDVFTFLRPMTHVISE